jgi:hypothetical protein
MTAPGPALLPSSTFPAGEPTTIAANRRHGHDARQHAWQREMEKAELEAWFRYAAQEARATPTRLAAAPLFAVAGAPALVDAAIVGPPSAAASNPEHVAEATRSMRSDDPSPSALRSPSAAPSATSRDPARAVTGRGGVGDLAGQAPDPLLPGQDESATIGALPATGRDGAVGVQAVAIPAVRGLVAARALPASTVSIAATTSPVFVSPSATPAAASPAADPRPVSLGRLAAAATRAFAPSAPVRVHVEWKGEAATVWLGVDRQAALELPQLVERLSRWMSRLGVRLRSVVCNGTVCFTPRDEAVARSGSTHVDVVVEKEI